MPNCTGGSVCFSSAGPQADAVCAPRAMRAAAPHLGAEARSLLAIFPVNFMTFVSVPSKYATAVPACDGSGQECRLGENCREMPCVAVLSTRLSTGCKQRCGVLERHIEGVSSRSPRAGLAPCPVPIHCSFEALFPTHVGSVTEFLFGSGDAGPGVFDVPRARIGELDVSPKAVELHEFFCHLQ